jgi:hypothetical protein
MRAIDADALKEDLTRFYDNEVTARKLIDEQPTIQPEITHEQAVEYLQSTGWMQEHDRQMMLDGAHRLTAQPETTRRIVGKSKGGMTLWYECERCGEPVDEGDKFCRGCGAKMEETT